MDELNLSLSFPFSFSAIKLGIAWSNCSITQLGSCVPISFRCLGSDLCYCRKQLCSQWASWKKKNQKPYPWPSSASPLCCFFHIRKLNCLWIVSKGKSDIETGYSQVLSEAGIIAKDSFNPCLVGRETHTYRWRSRVRKQLRMLLVFVWLEF